MSWRYGWETLGAFRIRSLFKTFCSSSTGKAGMALLQGCLWLGVTWIQNPNWIRRSGCNFRFRHETYVTYVQFCSVDWFSKVTQHLEMSQAASQQSARLWGNCTERFLGAPVPNPPGCTHSPVMGFSAEAGVCNQKKYCGLVGALGMSPYSHFRFISIYHILIDEPMTEPTLSDCFPQDAASKTL